VGEDLSAYQKAKESRTKAQTADSSEVRVFGLRYAESDVVARALSQTYPHGPVRIVSDARANRIVAVGPPERLRQIAELIQQLDQAPPE
jgi:type II secretory pathway component GspD/PulD (secretin)